MSEYKNRVLTRYCEKLVSYLRGHGELCGRAMHAAVTELSILLLQGETGAGKQLVARIVHCNSMGAHFAGRLPKG